MSDWTGPTQADLPEEAGATETHATRMFNMHWANDYDLYHAVLNTGRSLLREDDSLDDEALGEAVIATVREWCEANPDPNSVLGLLAREVGDFDDVDPASVGEDVRQGLGLE